MSSLVTTEHQSTVVRIVRMILPNSKILAFGSRIQGNAKPYSDLDIAIQMDRDITFSEMSQLKSALSETDIPYMIDVMDFRAADPAFQKIILLQCQEW